MVPHALCVVPPRRAWCRTRGATCVVCAICVMSGAARGVHGAACDVCGAMCGVCGATRGLGGAMRGVCGPCATFVMYCVAFMIPHAAFMVPRIVVKTQIYNYNLKRLYSHVF